MQINYSLFYTYCIICILNLLVGINRVKKKQISYQNRQFRYGKFVIYRPLDNFLLFILIIMMLYISIKTINVPDIDVYIRHYRVLNKNVFEIGYYLISSFASNLHLSFEWFRGIVICSSIILMYKGINKLGFNKNICFSIYAVYPFTLDVIQVRNFLALGIIIYALHFLSERTIVGRMKFCLAIAIASSIHSLSVIYYVLLLADYDILEKKWKQRTLGIIFILSVLFSFLLRSSGEIQQLVFNIFALINESKVSAYVNWNIQWGFILYWFLELIFIFIAYKIFKYQTAKKIGSNYERLFWNNIVLACLFPLLTININFFRIFRNISIMNYALLDVIVIKKKNLGLLILFIFAVALNYYFNINTDINNTFWVFFQTS
ncbi:MAG: EpsG family protein [Anaerorhabdus sp.]|uniref:EpsG family protein n=1 Tax=Anaerorhabdus sp. TaxID=1872524 RepID=UPI002FC7D173